MKKTINIGLLGLGTVGQGVCEVLAKNQKIIEARTNLVLVIQKAVVKSINKKRSPLTKGIKLSTDYKFVTNDPKIDVVVELLTDKDLAFKALKSAKAQNKGFVTANKSMIAEYGKGFWDVFSRHKNSVGFEASVGGALPIIRALKDGFKSEDISLIAAIINGTANYILTEMSKKKIDFSQALRKATEAGYAEADPAFDINGSDTAHKMCIMANLAFDRYFEYQKINKQGIEKLSIKDILWAQNFGYVIKLLGIAKKDALKKNSFVIAVHPTMIKKTSILADVKGVYNATLLRGDFLGDSLIYGQGAGAKPTAISVVSDVIEVAKNRSEKNIKDDRKTDDSLYKNIAGNLIDLDEFRCEHYLRIMVKDEIGVLSRLAEIISQHKVSISQIVQKPEINTEKTKNPAHKNLVGLVVITHHASSSSIEQIIKKIVTQKFYAGEYCHLFIDNSI